MKATDAKSDSPLAADFGWVALATVALPLVLAWTTTPLLTGRVAVWRWRATKPLICVSALIAGAAVTAWMATLTAANLVIGNWPLAAMCLLGMWVGETPWAALVAALRLRHFATQLRDGRIAPNRSEPARKAIRGAAFADAKAAYAELSGQLPAMSQHGHPVVGVSAEPVDHRHPWERFIAPDHHTLTDASDEGLAVMRFDPRSPAHHLVLAETGSGKTVLLSRVGLAALRAGWRLAVLDFKGSPEEAQVYLSLANRCDRPITTRHWPGDPLDLFRGEAAAVAQRISGFLPPPTGGGAEYYRARIHRAVSAVVVRTSAPVPRSATELIERVRKAGSFAEDPEDRATLLGKEQGREVCVSIAEALGSYLEPLRQTGAYATSGGFSWPDGWDLAVISLDATSEQQLRLGSAVLHDFDAWTRSPERWTDPRPLLLIIDEGGALSRINGAPALTNLVARARSAQVGVVIAAQTLTSLGIDGEELLNTGPIRWLGRTPAPELVAMAGGTRRVVETGHQDDQEGVTGVRALREQSAFVVDPDDARSLPNFFWIVSQAGRAAHIYAPPL